MNRYLDRARKELFTPLLLRELAVEFVSTFILVSVQCILPLRWGEVDKGSSLVRTGIGMGFTVVMIVWALGEMGLVLMNPAPTLAFILAGKITLPKG